MKRFSILLMALATLISCDELQKYMNGNGEDDENSPDKGKIEFPDGASVQLDDQGKGSLRIVATHYWSANLDGHGTDTSWLTMEPMSAEEGGEYTLQFTADGQPTNGQSRGVEVIIKVGTDHKFRFNVDQGGNGGQGGVFISSVSLNPAGPLNMKVGDHVEVYASYLPENATMTNLRWDKPDGTDTFDIVSNNPLQATIHAMRPGSATITVKAPTPDGQNNGPQATLDVTVTE